MSIKTGFSILTNAKDNVAELSSSLKQNISRLVLYFASSNFDQAKLSAEFKKTFPSSIVVGCSTAGEIVSGKMLKHSVVAMSIGDDIVEDAAAGVVEKIRTEDNIPQVFGRFERRFNTRMADLDFRQYVGIILVDGLAGAEERIMDKIGDLTNVTFIGGSAGDDLAFKQTFVCAEGNAYSNAAVLVLLKLKRRFDTIKTQSFSPMNKWLRATSVDEAARTVIEFNHKPAIAAYAEFLNVSVDKAPNEFMTHPVGLITSDGQPYVRSPQQVKGSSMVFYCNIKEGMELSLLESTDIVAETKTSVEKKIKELGSVAGIINFHCILRTLELEQKKQTEAYGQLFSNVPTIGFSTYGEEYIGHINQTSTMLIFK
jgi:hypothetical protein